jgi:hypothetical protein
MKFTDLGEIAIAWYRSANPTPEQQDLAIERLAICGACEFSKRTSVFDIYKCSACGCPLHKKVFSSPGPNACPKGKWPR